MVDFQTQCMAKLGFMSLQGFILEHKPEDAAGIIQVLNQVPRILCAC